MTKGKRKYRIIGVVIDRQTQAGLADLRIEAWDKDHLFDDLLGTAITDAAGAFQIQFDETYFQEFYFDQDPDVFFRVFCGDALIKTTEDDVMWNVKTTVINVKLEIDFHDQISPELSCELRKITPVFDTKYYQVGGSLEYQHPTYIVRQADQELYQALQNGEFCCVLNSRQMGKSSLRVQMMKRLQKEGVKCASIDMTQIGSDVTPAEWYGGVVSNLIRGFGLTSKINFSDWWRDRGLLSPIQRLSEFIEDVILVEFKQNIIIFIDEIDSVLKFTFRNDFFSLIRTCYDRRAAEPDYKRLTFAFLGVATPSDLIANCKGIPFNIGRTITLEGFRLDEAQPLVQGLTEKASQPKVVLQEVLAWTGGQPFLTQKLCGLIAASPLSIPKGKEVRAVEAIVKSYILDNWIAQDEPEHLRTIRDRLLREDRSLALLRLYRQILLKGYISADGGLEQMLLRLSGVVVQRDGKLFIYNRIYQSLFNLSWNRQEIERRERVREHERELEPEQHSFFERYRRLFQLFILLIIGMICVIALRLFPYPAPSIDPAGYFSGGEQILIQKGDIPEKDQIATLIKQQNYGAAVKKLTTFLSKNPNEPEALVMLNNAKIGQNPRQQQPYHHTIAVALPISDKTIDQAQEILRGVAQAQSEINQQGGIKGVPVKVLMVKDDYTKQSSKVKDDYKKQLSKQVATILAAESPYVLGIVGHYISDMSEIAGKIYQRNHVVMISPTSTAMDISKLGDYIFRTVPSDQASAIALADYMVGKQQKKNAAVFYTSDSVYSQSLTRAFKAALEQPERGGKVVATFDFNTDFDALNALNEAKHKRAEVLILLNSTAKRERAIEVMKQNDGRLPVLGGDSLYDPATLQAGEPAIGAVVAVPWVFQRESDFAQRARKLWRADVSWRTVAAYDATQALIAGLKDPSRKGIQRILSDPNFSIDGAVKKIRFTPDGDRAAADTGNQEEAMELAIVQPDPTSKKYKFVTAP